MVFKSTFQSLVSNFKNQNIHPNYKYFGKKEIIAQIIEMIQKITKEVEITANKIKQISIGTPGILSDDGKLSLGANIGNLDGMHLANILRKLFDVEVDVENDLNLAAVGEFLHGAAKEVMNFALIQLGTGIGAGLFIDGQLVRGSRGAAGEVSFLPLFGTLAGPGNHGRTDIWNSGITDPTEPAITIEIPLIKGQYIEL